MVNQPHDPEAIIDWPNLKARLMDDMDFCREVLESFIEDASLRIERCGEALHAGRWEQAQREAHTVKGAAANVSAEVCRATALELEDACRKQNVDEAECLLESLSQHVTNVKNELDNRN